MSAYKGILIIIIQTGGIKICRVHICLCNPASAVPALRPVVVGHIQFFCAISVKLLYCALNRIAFELFLLSGIQFPVKFQFGNLLQHLRKNLPESLNSIFNEFELCIKTGKRILGFVDNTVGVITVTIGFRHQLPVYQLFDHRFNIRSRDTECACDFHCRQRTFISVDKDVLRDQIAAHQRHRFQIRSPLPAVGNRQFRRNRVCDIIVSTNLSLFCHSVKSFPDLFPSCEQPAFDRPFRNAQRLCDLRNAFSGEVIPDHRVPVHPSEICHFAAQLGFFVRFADRVDFTGRVGHFHEHVAAYNLRRTVLFTESGVVFVHERVRQPCFRILDVAAAVQKRQCREKCLGHKVFCIRIGRTFRPRKTGQIIKIIQKFVFFHKVCLGCLCDKLFWTSTSCLYTHIVAERTLRFDLSAKFWIFYSTPAFSCFSKKSFITAPSSFGQL